MKEVVKRLSFIWRRRLRAGGALISIYFVVRDIARNYPPLRVTDHPIGWNKSRLVTLSLSLYLFLFLSRSLVVFIAVITRTRA